jgi:hypothetical protein
MKIHPRLKTNTAKLFYSNSFFKILSFAFLPYFLYQMEKDEFTEFNVLVQITVLISVLCSCYKEFFAKSYLISLKNKTLSLNLDFNKFLFLTLFFFLSIFTFFFVFQVDSIIFKQFNFVEANYKKTIIFFLVFFFSFDLLLSTFLYNEQKIKNLFLYNLALFIIINLSSIIFFFLFENFNKAYLRLLAMIIAYFIVCTYYFVYVKKKYNLFINFYLNFKTLNFNIFIFLTLNAFFIFISLFDKFAIYNKFGTDLLSEYYLVLLFCVPAQLFISSVNQGLLPQMYNNNFLVSNLFFLNKVKKLLVALVTFYFATYFLIILLLKTNFIPNNYTNVPNLFLAIFFGFSILNILPLINNFLIKNNFYNNLYLFNFAIIFIQFFIFTYFIHVMNIFLILSLYSISLLVFFFLEILFLKKCVYGKY